MKRIKYLLLTVFLLVSLFGCSSCGSQPKKEHVAPEDGYFITKDLENATVGIIGNCTEESAVSAAIPGVVINKYDDTLSAVSALKEDKVRALVLDSVTTQLVLRDNADLKRMLQPVSDAKYYAAVYIPLEDRADKGDAFLLEVDAAMTRVRDSKLITTLYDCYFSDNNLKNISVEYNSDNSKGRVLKVGVARDNIPFSYENTDGKYVGIDIEIANEIAKSYHATLEIIPYDRDALLGALENGEINVAFGRLTKADDASEEDWLLFSMPYFDAAQNVVMIAENVGVNPLNPQAE